MYDILIEIEGKKDFRYQTSIVPVIGDTIQSPYEELKSYVVIKRIITTNLPNFIIIKAQ